MAYNEFAYFYDEFNGEADYDALYSHIHSQLEAHGIRDGILADLGCGTGTIACYLAAQGYRVTATDLSEEMLTEAASKAMELERPPLFLCQSMPRLRLTEPVDAVVSQATRASGSWARMASSTASEIWSQILSGWPSVTDSEVNSRFAIIFRPFFCRGDEKRSAEAERQSPCTLIFRYTTAGFGTLRNAGCRASSGRSLHHS